MAHFEIFTCPSNDILYSKGDFFGFAFDEFISAYTPIMRVQADTIDALLDNVPAPTFRYRSVDKKDIEVGDIVAGDCTWYLRTENGFRVIWGTKNSTV